MRGWSGTSFRFLESVLSHPKIPLGLFLDGSRVKLFRVIANALQPFASAPNVVLNPLDVLGRHRGTSSLFLLASLAKCFHIRPCFLAGGGLGELASLGRDHVHGV